MAELPESARQAMALYAILARDWTDFLELLPEADEDAIRDLYRMLIFKRPPDEDEGTTDYELNATGAEVVERHAEDRGIKL